MRRQIGKLCGLALLMASLCCGQSVVASAIASGPFILGGLRIPTEGVPSWPVLAGDRIASGVSLVTITTTDGSRINVDRNSVVTVERTPAGVSVRVEQGTATYNLTRGGVTEVVLTRASTPPASGSGTISTIGTVKPVGGVGSGGIGTMAPGKCCGHYTTSPQWYDPSYPDCSSCPAQPDQSMCQC